MSAISIQSSGSGAGTLTIAAPITATNRTLTLPDATTTFVGTDATQTLTNKTIQGGAITSGTAVASTSGTSIDFTSIPSWVKRITVMFSGVSTSGTSPFLFQLGAGSVTSSGYQSAGVTLQNAQTVGGASSTSGVISNNALTATDSYGGCVVFNLLGSNIWVAIGQLVRFSGTYQNLSFSGQVTLSGTLDRVRVTTVNGTDTFDAGSVNILYE